MSKKTHTSWSGIKKKAYIRGKANMNPKKRSMRPKKRKEMQAKYQRTNI